MAVPTTMSPTLGRGLLALTVGAAGGWLGWLIDMPLAWMLGSMIATTVAAIAGLPMAIPMQARGVMIAVLGVMLGSGFSPELLERLGDWALSLAGLALYIAVSGGLGYLYFRKVTGYDRITAYFSAMPGGFSEMVIAGSAMGGDGRTIALVHASRVLLVVIALPYGMRFALGVESVAAAPAGVPLAALTATDAAVLLACGLVGYLAARALRIPAATIVGPMVLSAAVHLFGLTEAAVPSLLVAVAQVVVGSAVGCRFAGTEPSLVYRTALAGAGVTAILVVGTLVFAFALNALAGLPVTVLIFAYVPGGLAEMSLIALALGLDAAFVATHHIVRICLIIVFAPLAFRRFERDPP